MAASLRDGAGGIAGLAAVLTDHADAVEADLQRHFGVDLRDLWRPGRRLTYRRLRVLLRHLPPEAATVRLVHGDAVTWTRDHHLLAAVLDALNIGNWQRGNAGAKSPSPRPKPLPRPGVGFPRPGRLTPEKLALLRQRGPSRR